MIGIPPSSPRNARRRNVLLALVAVALLMAGGAVALVMLTDRGERREATPDPRIALADELADSAALQMSGDPELALLLARESERAWRSPRTEATLRKALLGWPLRGVVNAAGDDSSIEEAEFSPDSKLLAMRDDEGNARLWRVGIGGTLLSTNRTFDDVTSLRFTFDSKWLVTGHDDGGVQVTGLESGDPSTQWQAHESRIDQVSISPRGDTLLTMSEREGTVDVWARTALTNTASLLRYNRLVTLDAPGVKSAIFNNDGSRIATIGLLGATRVWHAQSGRLLLALTEETPPELPPGTNRITGPHYLEFSPDGKLVACTTGVGNVHIWDIAVRKLVAEIPIEYGIVKNGPGLTSVTALRFSPTSDRLAIGDTWGRVQLWDTVSGRPAAPELQTGTPIMSMGWTPDGTQVITASSSGAVHIWDATAGTSAVVTSVQDSEISGAQVSSDGKWIVTTSRDDGTARIWWSGLPDVLTEMRGPAGSPGGVSFSPDGKWVIASYGGEAWVWEGGTGERVARLSGQRGTLNQAAISPDGNWIATLSDDGSTWVWNTGTWDTSARLQEGADLPAAVAAAFHPEGTYLAIAGVDNRLRVWDVSSEELLETEASFPDSISSVEYGPRGEQLLVASGSLLYVLDADTGDEIFTLGDGKEQIWRAHWSRDGSAILAATASGLQAWEARTGEPLPEPRSSFALGDAVSADLGRDGRWLVTLDDNSRVSVLSVETGAELMQIPLGGDGAHVALSPTGRDIAVAGEGAVRIYTCEVCIGLRELLMLADKRLTRDLTCEERNTYLHTTEACPTPTE